MVQVLPSLSFLAGKWTSGLRILVRRGSRGLWLAVDGSWVQDHLSIRSIIAIFLNKGEVVKGALDSYNFLFLL